MNLRQQDTGRKPEIINCGYSDAQREIAEKAKTLILSDLGHHITIAELARSLHVSPTQVKVCFHRVYGMPVFTYARQRRMESAAKMLEETEESILEIAGQFGYENGSKFAAAFRQVIGFAPGEYRRRIRWEQENQPDSNGRAST